MSGLFNPAGPDGRTAWDWAHHIYDKLCHIEEALVPDTKPPVSRMRVPFVFPTDASGNGQVTLDLRPGLAWTLLTYAFQIPFTSTPTGYVAFYRDSEEGTSLITVVTASTVIDGAFNAEGHYVPEQSRLLVVARGALANSQVSGNIAAKSTLNHNPETTVSEGGN